MAEVWICRMRGMRVGAAGAGVRRAAVGITGEGPVRMRGAWALAAKEKAKAATEGKIRHKDTRKKKWTRKMSKEGKQFKKKKKNPPTHPT